MKDNWNLNVCTNIKINVVWKKDSLVNAIDNEEQNERQRLSKRVQKGFGLNLENPPPLNRTCAGRGRGGEVETKVNPNKFGFHFRT